MRTKPTFTNAAFVRSHGKNPSGRGSWIFCASRTEIAFTDDVNAASLVIAPHSLTLTEAKRWMAEQGNTGLWAVMP